VLSFPHGREAARTVAEKLGVPCVECGVPLGLQGTARWLAALAEATDRVAAARGFVEKELARAVPRVEWAVSHALEGARVGLCVDPVYLGPLADLVAETGGSVVLAIGTAGEEAMARLGPWDGLPVPVHGPVTENGLDELLDAADPIEVLVGGHRRWPEAVEVGYPSFLEHAIADRPFLGFEGCLALVHRLAERRTRTRFGGSTVWSKREGGPAAGGGRNA
jgi:nitrogenase molybdenum-iron protein alpha/beta subunit